MLVQTTSCRLDFNLSRSLPAPDPGTNTLDGSSAFRVVPPNEAYSLSGRARGPLSFADGPAEGYIRVRGCRSAMSIATWLCFSRQ